MSHYNAPEFAGEFWKVRDLPGGGVELYFTLTGRYAFYPGQELFQDMLSQVYQKAKPVVRLMVHLTAPVLVMIGLILLGPRSFGWIDLFLFLIGLSVTLFVLVFVPLDLYIACQQVRIRATRGQLTVEQRLFGRVSTQTISTPASLHLEKSNGLTLLQIKTPASVCGLPALDTFSTLEIVRAVLFRKRSRYDFPLFFRHNQALNRLGALLAAQTGWSFDDGEPTETHRQ